MWRWLRRLLAPTSASERSGGPVSALRIAFDTDRILLHASDGTEGALPWQDLGSVAILTNDTGPFKVELHWILTSRDGRQTLSVPMGTTGEDALLHELQRRLPDFDNEAVILAMGSTVNATFKVWRHAL
jgi:hypothetical protein